MVVGAILYDQVLIRNWSCRKMADEKLAKIVDSQKMEGKRSRGRPKFAMRIALKVT